MSRRRVVSEGAEGAQAGRSAHRRVAVLLFVLALVVRVMFWQATADRAWAWSAAYKGDAPKWLAHATALEADASYEIGRASCRERVYCEV